MVGARPLVRSGVGARPGHVGLLHRRSDHEGQLLALLVHRPRVHAEQQPEAGRTLLSAGAQRRMRRPVCAARARRHLVQVAKVRSLHFARSIEFARFASFTLSNSLDGNGTFQSYQNAEVSMRRAYAKLKSSTHKAIFKEWEPLLNNLGHVCRKLK